MSEMVERVARKMLASNTNTPDSGPWDHMTENMREYYRSMARAAIKAMRKPTRAMFEAGHPHARERFTEGVWEAMIDEALK